jgi:hypothetical protein
MKASPLMAQIAKSMTVSVSVPCAALSIFGLLAIYFWFFTFCCG